MKNILLFLLIALSISAQAQKIRYTDKRNHWISKGVVGADHLCTYTRLVSLGSDTVINSHSYTRIINAWAPDECAWGMIDDSLHFVREDTATGKVYEFSPASPIPGSDTGEHLLFDYNLIVGDTLNNFGTRDSVIYLDSTLINGVYHKVIGVGRAEYINPGIYVYIEGFGSLNCPIYPLNYCFEHFEWVVCFYQDSNYITVQTIFPSCIGIDSINTVSGCASVAVHDVNKFTPAISISPNPAIDEIKISVERGPNKNLFLSIYDMRGGVVFNQNIYAANKDATINCSSWPEGIYLVVVQTEDGILKKEKIVVQR